MEMRRIKRYLEEPVGPITHFVCVTYVCLLQPPQQQQQQTEMPERFQMTKVREESCLSSDSNSNNKSRRSSWTALESGDNDKEPRRQTSIDIQRNIGGIACYNGACKHGKPPPGPGYGASGSSEYSVSPWHRLKTFFLLFFVVALLLWLLVYGSLARLKLL